MLKQVTFTFNFDTETEEISGITTFIDGVEKKKKTTKKAKAEVVLENESIITLTETKLEFNNKAVAEMGIEHENRIVIEFQKVTGKVTPIVGTDESFKKEGTGNKLTKTNTVAYKGKQNTILSEYGSEFALEPFGDGLWKMVSKSPEKSQKAANSFEAAITLAENTDTDLLIEDDNTDEIDPLSFTITI